jgi:hypothetical protein
LGVYGLLYHATESCGTSLTRLLAATLQYVRYVRF